MVAVAVIPGLSNPFGFKTANSAVYATTFVVVVGAVPAPLDLALRAPLYPKI